MLKKSPVLRPGFSETFPYPTRFSGGPSPLAYFDAGSGPVVLLVHGLGGNFTHWEHVAPALARHHRVIGVDLLGCGDSAKPPLVRYTIDMLVDAIVRLLDELQINDATWVGHSLGGMVVTRAALRFPARVQRLVLIDAAGFVKFPAALRMAAHGLFAPFVAKTLEHIAIRLLTQTFHQRNFYTQRFISLTEGRPANPTVEEIARFICAIAPDATRLHFLRDLERIVQPTLVLWGDKDRLLPIEPMWKAVRKMPSARLVVLHDCGHMPIIERPAAVVSELLGFFAERTRTRRTTELAQAV